MSLVAPFWWCTSLVWGFGCVSLVREFWLSGFGDGVLVARVWCFPFDYTVTRVWLSDFGVVFGCAILVWGFLL